MTRFNRCRKVGVVALGSAMFGLGGLTGAAINAVPVSASNGNFSCNASAITLDFTAGPLSAFGVIAPIVANAANDPCTGEVGTLLDLPLPTGTGDHVTLLQAETTDDETVDPRTATAKAGVLDLQVGGTTLQAKVLTSHAEESQPCDAAAPTRSGDSDVASVVLLGSPVPIPFDKTTPATPTLDLSPLATLWLREEIVTPDSLTERALELDTPIVNVIVAESRVDDSVPFQAPSPPCCPPPNTVNPSNGACCPKDGPVKCPTTPCPKADDPNATDTDETNPFVDPTAKATMGKHPDCVPEFSEPKGNGDAHGQDYVHFVRDINDNETSPNGAFVPKTVEDSRDRFNGEAGFREDGDLKPMIEGKFYDDEDMRFRLEPKSIDAYYAPNDLAASPWRRFCGVGTIDKFGSDDPATMTLAEKMATPAAPFKVDQERKFLVETFDAKWLNPDNPGGDQSDYWVIDIYKPGSSFDTKKCDPASATADHPTIGGHDHGENENPNHADLDYHSEGQTIAGNIQIHSDRFLRPS